MLETFSLIIRSKNIIKLVIKIDRYQGYPMQKS
jgi:hypothetical protein